MEIELSAHTKTMKCYLILVLLVSLSVVLLARELPNKPFVSKKKNLGDIWSNCSKDCSCIQDNYMQ